MFTLTPKMFNQSQKNWMTMCIVLGGMSGRHIACLWNIFIESCRLHWLYFVDLFGCLLGLYICETYIETWMLCLNICLCMVYVKIKNSDESSFQYIHQ